MTMQKILVEALQPLLDPTTGRMLVPTGTQFEVYGSLDALTGDYGGVLFPVALHEIQLVQAPITTDLPCEKKGWIPMQTPKGKILKKQITPGAFLLCYLCPCGSEVHFLREEKQPCGTCGRRYQLRIIIGQVAGVKT